MANNRTKRINSSNNKDNPQQKLMRFFQSIHTVQIPHNPCPYPTTNSNPTLANLLPPELCIAMNESAQKGFLHTFLCTLDENILTEYLKIKMYSPGQIYWINKAIKSLTLIALGAAIGKTLSTPLLNILIANTTGVSENFATYITSAGFFIIDLITRKNLGAEHDIASATLIYCAGLAAGVLGNLAGRMTYHYGPILMQNNVFAAREKEVVLQMEAIDEEPDEKPAERKRTMSI